VSFAIPLGGSGSEYRLARLLRVDEGRLTWRRTEMEGSQESHGRPVSLAETDASGRRRDLLLRRGRICSSSSSCIQVVLRGGDGSCSEMKVRMSGPTFKLR